MKLMILLLSLISVSAFAETNVYQGKISQQGGYVGVQTQNAGFIALDASVMSSEQKASVRACYGKEATVTVEDRGMISQLDSISCE